MINIKNIKTKKIRAGDIKIAYKKFGRGYPLVLVMGYMGTMDCWDPALLKMLSLHYRVIIFDNRGMGETSASEKKFSIKLFADDLAKFLKALKIKKCHMLGWSMGSNIALEFVLKYPKKVNKLILYAADCGGRRVIPASRKVISKRKLHLSKYLPHPDCCGTPENIGRQTKAIEQWKGVYRQLSKIKAHTLVVTGADDILIPPENSALISKNIKHSWLIQIKGGGHAVMFQYPKGFSSIVHTFLQA